MVRPKKNLGQHFLTDLGIARRIADTVAASTLPADAAQYASLPLLEIGPGMGVLTKFLLEQPREVTAIELDSESVDYLHKNIPDLRVLHADFLKADLAEIESGEFALIGNYPYNISSQIFFKVLDYRQSIPLVAGMLQREVAQRICSGPGTKVRGILSVLLQAWYDCEYLFTVSESVFNPPPKVKSGVIRLIRNSRTSLGCDEKLFKTIVKTSFGQRRKTMRNSLSGFIAKDSPALADPLFAERPERLSVDDFIRLTNLIEAERAPRQTPSGD